MKILVLSDSHGNIGVLKNVISRNIYGTDLVIFLGDRVEDIQCVMNEFPTAALLYVYGNCDYVPIFKSVVEYNCVTLENVKIMFTHGHRFNVKFGESNLVYKAKNEKARLVLYGHTHVAKLTEYDGLTVLNPGSVSMPRDNSGGTYGVVNINNGSVHCEIKEV